jgi:hypothetical protein
MRWKQYRNIEIMIVPMGAPGGWKWTVTINGKQWSGHRRDREDAILSAERFIDRRLSWPIVSETNPDALKF